MFDLCSVMTDILDVTEMMSVSVISCGFVITEMSVYSGMFTCSSAGGSERSRCARNGYREQIHD